ncbi:MAG: hypothetical protein IKU36_02110 [Bacteroidales bacterium]|nr:hypothetical protein [Bacteroidales bacterium]
MKFREQVVKYDIDKHGSEYVDCSTPVYICPECSSSETKLKEGCCSTYVCPDCGCEFRQHQVQELTRAGKTMKKVLSVLTVLCLIGVLAGFVIPIAFYEHQETILGEEVARELYYVKSIVIGIVISVTSILLGCFFSIKYEKI